MTKVVSITLQHRFRTQAYPLQAPALHGSASTGCRKSAIKCFLTPSEQAAPVGKPVLSRGCCILLRQVSFVPGSRKAWGGWQEGIPEVRRGDSISRAGLAPVPSLPALHGATQIGLGCQAAILYIIGSQTGGL